jgi:taurine dioxygenase
MDRTPRLSATKLAPALGAVVSGLDASQPLDAEMLENLRALWREHLVLVARDQTLDDPALLRFSRHFGELDPPGPNPYGRPYLPAFPEINVVANVEINGIPGNLGSSELVWHADMTYVATPPKGAVLYALEVPPEGGDTYFANLVLAFQALPVALRRAIEGRSAIHDATYNSSGMIRKGYQPVTYPRAAPGARHPLIRIDPDTGRESLFLGRRRNSYIVGLEISESDALLDALWAHATRPEFVMAHSWRAGDLLLWDNRRTLHRRDVFDPAVRRVMHRTQIRAEQAA